MSNESGKDVIILGLKVPIWVIVVMAVSIAVILIILLLSVILLCRRRKRRQQILNRPLSMESFVAGYPDYVGGTPDIIMEQQLATNGRRQRLVDEIASITESLWKDTPPPTATSLGFGSEYQSSLKTLRKSSSWDSYYTHGRQNEVTLPQLTHMR